MTCWRLPMPNYSYYNEFDPGAAAWLRELIKAGLIPDGFVDERSITEVRPDDLEGFTQCHFFAGIGGWALALNLAGVGPDQPLWTGSPPCQPFSVAGRQQGQLDPRHLAPTFMRLIAQCRPAILFGEQVSAAISKCWLDDLFADLERQNYTCGAAVLPAAGVGAPHKRDRLFFGAVGNASRWGIDGGGYGRPSRGHEYSDDGGTGGMAHGDDDRQQSSSRSGSCSGSPVEGNNSGGSSEAGELAHANGEGSQGRGRVPECADKQPAGPAGMAGGMAHAGINGRGAGRLREKCMDECDGREEAERRDGGIATERFCDAEQANPNYSFWAGADWIGCRDGKFRPVRPGSFPLANGVPARVGRLRGAGNAIVPQVAAEFIKAFIGAYQETRTTRARKD